MKRRRKTKFILKDLSKLEKISGLKFKNTDLWHQALTHRSYLNEHKDWPYGQNERLEFLGDAVLELITTQYIYNKFNLPEGRLTSLRASLVNTESLANLARKINLDKFIYLSKGQAHSLAHAKKHILANTLEAFLGALYLDQGFKAVQKFLSTHLLKKAGFILRHQLYKNPKSTFQEIAQSRFQITPRYQTVKEVGPPHSKTFTVKLMLNGKTISQGTGKSRQEAEIKAAKKALSKYAQRA